MRPLVFVQQRPQQVDAPLYRSLAQLGVDLTVVVQGELHPRDPELGVVPDFGRVDDGYRSMREPVRLAPDSHVVVAGWSQGWAWRWMARLARTPQVTFGIRFDSVGFSTRSALRGLAGRQRARAALRLADIWHPTGSLSLDYAYAVCRQTKPSIPIPYVSDPTRFFERVGQPSVSPSETKGVLHVLVVAKLVEREGVETVLRAASLTTAVHVIVVGDGPLRTELEQLAGRLNVSAEFVGYIPYEQLPQWYANSDLFVHPALDEPWGVSVQEAVLCGVPVLASDRVGSAPETLGRPSTDWQFPAGNANQLVQLLEGMRPRGVRQRHREANRISVQGTKPEAVAAKLVEFLTESATR